MSEGESFLARWSRLKREHAGASSAGDTDSLPDAPETEAVPRSPPVDLAELPAIESLGAGSDVSPFLSEGVAPELTQAALRSAWRADPAVRDFVEIADNQWDFNEPEAMPGFGTLGTVSQARNLVIQALSSLDNTVEPPAVMPSAAAPTQQAAAGHLLEDAKVIDPVWRAGTVLPAQDEPAAARGQETRPASDQPAATRRLHGSALPK